MKLISQFTFPEGLEHMYVLILQLILSEGNHWVYLARQILAFAMHATEPSSK